MDLELTQEQSLLAESVRQLLAQHQGPAAWPALVEFGALEIATGEDVGAVELALVARELGERLEATPLIDAAAALYAARGTAVTSNMRRSSGDTQRWRNRARGAVDRVSPGGKAPSGNYCSL